MCPTHYERIRRGGKERKINNAPYPECSVSHCDLEATSRVKGSICKPHYQKKWRGVDPETYVIPPDHPARKAPVCREDKCQRVSVTAGYCDYHRLRAQRGKIFDPDRRVKVNKACRFSGCERVSAQAELCQAHYEQLRVKGELTELREYAKYVKGELKCPVPRCRKPQAAREVCNSHAHMLRKYDVSLEDLIEIWSDPRCENPGCGGLKRLHMDHDHITGKFRALLCSGCNTALGLAKEDAGRLRGLAEYIERF